MLGLGVRAARPARIEAAQHAHARREHDDARIRARLHVDGVARSRDAATHAARDGLARRAALEPAIIAIGAVRRDVDHFGIDDRSASAVAAVSTGAALTVSAASAVASTRAVSAASATAAIAAR